MSTRLDPDRLLIGVVAHCSREPMASALAERVRAQVLNVDRGRARTQEEAFDRCTNNHLEVMRKLKSLVSIHNSWCIVLEDDALPIEDFRIHAAAALAEARSPIIGFYMNRAGVAMNRGPITRAADQGMAWAVSNAMISAVAYAIHVDYLTDIIAHFERDDYATAEGRFNHWAWTRRPRYGDESRFHYTIPSLVDHGVGDSLIFDGAHTRLRMAWRVGAAADWDTPAVEYDPDSITQGDAMKVGMVGMGKLGLPVALAIESKGFEVYGTDVNTSVKTYLSEGKIPYREEGLQPLLDANTVHWRDSIAEIVRDTNLIFVAIQTPHGPEYEGVTPLPDTRADFDYTYLQQAVSTIATECAEQKKHRVVAVISTCLPGTFTREIKPLLNEYTAYAYVPQFIAMGTVLADYLNPEFNLIGVEDPDAADMLEDFYSEVNGATAVRTDVTTAEGIKVSYNTWITAKTVIANAWGEMSERLGMNFDDIHKAWSLSDKRLISTRYMSAGMSDGGGCHPRDNIALSWLAEQAGMSHNLWDDLMIAREDYEAWHAELIVEAADEHELPIVLLGKAFKAETDIETGSPSMLVGEILRQTGVQFLHTNDMHCCPRAVYFIATRNERYKDYEFADGSIVLDPFGTIKDRKGVTVRRLGRR